jgi:hypothetical protein
MLEALSQLEEENVTYCVARPDVSADTLVSPINDSEIEGVQAATSYLV